MVKLGSCRALGCHVEEGGSPSPQDCRQDVPGLQGAREGGRKGKGMYKPQVGENQKSGAQDNGGKISRSDVVDVPAINGLNSPIKIGLLRE